LPKINEIVFKEAQAKANNVKNLKYSKSDTRVEELGSIIQLIPEIKKKS